MGLRPAGRRFAGYGQAPPLMSANQIKIVSDFLSSAREPLRINCVGLPGSRSSEGDARFVTSRNLSWWNGTGRGRAGMAQSRDRRCTFPVNVRDSNPHRGATYR